MSLSLQRKRIDCIPRESIVDELRRVAAHYNNRRFTRHEFDRVAKSCKGTAVLNAFGSWSEALDLIGIKLNFHKASRIQIPDAELFSELGRIWKNLGHRPSKTEWELSSPKYSYTTYKTRFGGWTKACACFLESSRDGTEDSSLPPPSDKESEPKPSVVNSEELKRNIPLKLRLKVFQRDNFKCVFCGNSPALNPGTILHVDHVQAYKKSGLTLLENLQTLCQDCNWGKGADQQFSVQLPKSSSAK